MAADSLRRLVPWIDDTDTMVDRMLGPNWLSDVRRPLMDLREQDKQYVLTLEVPGIDKNDIHVRPHDGGIEVSAERGEESESEDEGRYHYERNYRSFHRFCSLPEGANPDKASAQLRNGVLTVTVPKSKEAQKTLKEIEVR